MAHVQRTEVLLAIHAHLAESGPVAWEVLRAKFPGVPARSFWRWVAEAKAAAPLPAHIEAARHRLQQMTATLSGESGRPEEAGVARLVPAVPPPAVIAKNGKALDLLSELCSLWRDAYSLREAAVRREAATEKIVNPRLYDRSLAARLKLIEVGITVRRELWDLQRMETFYNTIIDTIAGCSPEVAQEIQHRLAILNSETGMTCSVDD